MSIVMEINPFDFFTDTSGDALDAGFIYIGQPNLDPRQYPVAAYYDAALTIPAAMPLRTSNGYIARNGSPTFLYIDGNYSILVQNKNRRQIYYVADFLMIGNSQAISYSDLANTVDPTKGAGLVGWKRASITSTIDNVHEMLDAQPLSLWEFADSVVSKPTPADPATWDWAPAITAAVAYAQANGRIELSLPIAITIRSQVNIDINKVILTGPSTINCLLGVAGQYAITFNSSATTPYLHVLEVVRNVEFYGDNVCNGLRFQGGNSVQGVSHLLFNSLNVHDFVDGYSFFNNAYIMTFLNCDGFNCARVFFMPDGSVNAGERLTFHGGTYFNSDRLIFAGSGEWYFTNCSFDFSKHLCYAKGMVTFDGCHGEFITGVGYDNIIEVVFEDTEKCSVIIRGGEWLNLAESAANVVKFTNATTRLACRCIFDRAFCFNVNPTSGYWASGNGSFTMEGLASTAWNASLTPYTHIDNNLLSDGGFEDVSATPIDGWYISADAGGIASRFVSTNLNVSVSTTLPFSGARSLKIVRTGGVISSATVSLLFPLDKKNVGMKFKMNKPTGAAGQIRVEAYWALAGDLYGVSSPRVQRVLSIDTPSSFTFTGATPGWIDYSDFTGYLDLLGQIKYNRVTKEKPDWANCVQIRFVTGSINASGGPEEIYIDNFEVYGL